MLKTDKVVFSNKMPHPIESDNDCINFNSIGGEFLLECVVLCDTLLVFCQSSEASAYCVSETVSSIVYQEIMNKSVPPIDWKMFEYFYGPRLGFSACDDGSWHKG